MATVRATVATQDDGAAELPVFGPVVPVFETKTKMVSLFGASKQFQKLCQKSGNIFTR